MQKTKLSCKTPYQDQDLNFSYLDLDKKFFYQLKLKALYICRMMTRTLGMMMGGREETTTRTRTGTDTTRTPGTGWTGWRMSPSPALDHINNISYHEVAGYDCI